LFTVQGFVEKPSFGAARQLFDRRALWNTFVMVGHVGSFLTLLNAALPGLVEHFRGGDLWAGSKVEISEFLYEPLDSTDFSSEVLEELWWMKPRQPLAVLSDAVREFDFKLSPAARSASQN
jgi:mannose-1-phosphate guanylyltransferase